VAACNAANSRFMKKSPEPVVEDYHHVPVGAGVTVVTMVGKQKEFF